MKSLDVRCADHTHSVFSFVYVPTTSRTTHMHTLAILSSSRSPAPSRRTQIWPYSARKGRRATPRIAHATCRCPPCWDLRAWEVERGCPPPFPKLPAPAAATDTTRSPNTQKVGHETGADTRVET